MKIQCWTIGKAYDSLVVEGIEQFTQRTGHYFPVSWNIIPSPKEAGKMDPNLLKQAEGMKVLSSLQPSDYLILLDEAGKNISSPQLSQILQKHAL